MDERAAAIFAEARENLERLDQIKIERRAFHDDNDWSRNMPREPAPFQQRHALTDAEILTLIDRRVETILARHRVMTARATATVVGEIRAQLRKEIVAAVGEVRADIEIAQAHRGSAVVEVPKFLARRSDAA